jgi:N-methylhydantoinase A/oxoprolinase/acetone carboxylase beta subunit
VEIVTLRIRRVGKRPALALPRLRAEPVNAGEHVQLFTSSGDATSAPVLSRAQLLAVGTTRGPLLVLDDEATTYIPPPWSAVARENGTVVLECA